MVLQLIFSIKKGAKILLPLNNIKNYLEFICQFYFTMKIYEDNHCEPIRNTRKSKRIANQRLKDITNEDRVTHQFNSQKPKKRNRVKKAKKKPMSEEMKALKLKYQELSKEPLIIIKARTKQNRITNAATSIELRKYLKMLMMNF